MLTLTSQSARQLLLDLQGLGKPPSGARDVGSFAATVESLGMVQLDSIDVLVRAHHHILWSRHTAYRSRSYDQLLTRQRRVFEHFTHDAAILPMDLYPYWQRQSKRRAERYERSDWGKEMASIETQYSILKRIESEGPVCSRDFTGQADKSKHAWMRPPHKLALDYLWLKGELSVSHRDKFIKYYDLTERVIPEFFRVQNKSDAEQINHLCSLALDKLGFASAGEIQRFWDAMSLSEVKRWIDQHPESVQEIKLKHIDGSTHNVYARPDIEACLDSLEPTTKRLRIVSPFDPIVRDRNRLSRLFGFDFRIEIYTPAKQRKYGYYVFPVLEGNRFVGRVEVRKNIKADSLDLLNVWWEPAVRSSKARDAKLDRELVRLARLVGVSEVTPARHGKGVKP